MKDFKELEEKYKDCLTEDIIKHYSLKYNLNREEAVNYQRLKSLACLVTSSARVD